MLPYHTRRSYISNVAASSKPLSEPRRVGNLIKYKGWRWENFEATNQALLIFFHVSQFCPRDPIPGEDGAVNIIKKGKNIFQSRTHAHTQNILKKQAVE